MAWEQIKVIKNRHDISVTGGRGAVVRPVWLARHAPVPPWGAALQWVKQKGLQKGGYAHGLKTTSICQKLCQHFLWPGEGKKKYMHRFCFLTVLIKKKKNCLT